MALAENSKSLEGKYRDNPLASLWAANESFSGTFLHALNIPFKGLYLSAFSVYILVLLNQFYNKRWECILSGLKVTTVKLGVNPFASVNSHFAVMIQSIIGELYRTIKIPLFIKLFFFSVFVFSFSAFQRLFTLWLFFGMSLYHALNVYSAKIISDMTGSIFGPIPDISYLLIAIYFSLHLIAAFPFTIFCYAAIKKLEREFDDGKHYVKKFQSTHRDLNSLSLPGVKFKLYIFYGVLLIALITATYFYPYNQTAVPISFIVIRFVSALVLFKLVLYIYKYFVGLISDKKTTAEHAMTEINTVYKYLLFAVDETTEKSWYKRIKESVLILTLLSIYAPVPEAEGKNGGLISQPPDKMSE